MLCEDLLQGVVLIHVLGPPEGFIMFRYLTANMLNNTLSFVRMCGLRYLRYHERRTIKQTYYSGESQIEVGQLPTEKTDGGKGQYA